MRRPSNKPLSTKECFEILGIGKKATLEELKSAYRKRAFELHPDLHPDVPDAARQFQLLNEAYVALSAVLKPGDPDRERERAEAERRERERAEAERAAAERRAQEREKARSEAERAAAERREKERERERARMAEKEAREERERERARERMRERVAEGRRRAEEEAARRAAEAGETGEAPKPEEAPEEEAAGESAAPRGGYAEEEVLRSLLNDPFARRVFEDIYSELNRQKKGRRVGDEAAGSADPDAGGERCGEEAAGDAGATPEPPRAEPEPRAEEKPRERKKFWRMPAMRPRTGVRKGGLKTLLEDGVTGWLRKQIDDEQTISLPGSQLVPGSRLRLNIRRGISGEMVMLEVSLPHDFIPGRPIRLRGMGRQVGPWQGDLYLILTPQ